MKTLFFLSIVTEIALVCIYRLSPKINASNERQLAGKTVCAVGFVMICVVARAAGEAAIGTYASLMLAGAIFGAFGDVFIALKKGRLGFVIGAVCFFVGHIFYLSAFSAASERRWHLVGAVAALLLTALLALVASRLVAEKPSKPVLIGAGIYSVTISFMLVKAFTLAANVFDESVPCALCLMLGATLFVVSDAFLSIGAYAKKVPRGRKYIVTFTYFAAQIFLVSTVYFI